MAGRKTNTHDAALLDLRSFGLAYPGAHLKSPWPGHLDLAVEDKTFAYLSLEGEPLAISCKLPQSSEDALMLPGAKPTAYGLGKWGWVSIAFDPADAIPVEMLKAWIDESYRSQAPKKLVRQLDGGAPSTGSAKKAPAKRASAKKAPAKKAPAKKASARTGR